MKKKFSAFIASALAIALFGGCGTGASSSLVSSKAESKTESLPPSSVASSAVSSMLQVPEGEMKIAGLKGPTTMGMVKLIEDAKTSAETSSYTFEMFGMADEIVPKLVSGEIDAAAIPANLASVIYNNTGGRIQVAAINTLGVLYVLENGDSVKSIQDLKGKTIYSTGKGTTPEFVLNYILKQNGIDPAAGDVKIEYKSEATEVAVLMAQQEDVIAVLPQPFATAVQFQNEKVKTVLNLTEEWEKVSPESALVTGVLVARTEFVHQNPELFARFLEDYSASINWVNSNVPEAAALVAQLGIVEKAPIAEKAIPASNIVFIQGQEMQQKLSGYLMVLEKANPDSIGGKMPEDGFYFLGA